jgi:hypothetical protein
MGFLIVISLLALSCSLIYVTFRRLRRRRATRSWWIASGSLLLAGLAVGIWFAFFFEYQPSAKLRVFSFPLPLVFFVLEGDRWTDFVPPSSVLYPGLAANVVATVAVILLPLFLASLFSHRERCLANDTPAT